MKPPRVGLESRRPRRRVRRSSTERRDRKSARRPGSRPRPRIRRSRASGAVRRHRGAPGKVRPRCRRAVLLHFTAPRSGAVRTSLNSSYFAEVSTWAVIPAPRNSTPAPAETHAAVICQGRSLARGAGCWPPPVTTTTVGGVAAGATAGAAGTGDGGGVAVAVVAAGATGAGACATATVSLTTTRSFWPAIGDTERTSSFIPDFTTRTSCVPGATPPAAAAARRQSRRRRR